MTAPSTRRRCRLGRETRSRALGALRSRPLAARPPVSSSSRSPPAMSVARPATTVHASDPQVTVRRDCFRRTDSPEAPRLRLATGQTTHERAEDDLAVKRHGLILGPTRRCRTASLARVDVSCRVYRPAALRGRRRGAGEGRGPSGARSSRRRATASSGSPGCGCAPAGRATRSPPPRPPSPAPLCDTRSGPAL